MSIDLRFSQPIPAGFCIFADYLEIAGVHHRRDDALRFATGTEQTIAFASEPDNPHDRNAIAIWGTSKTGASTCSVLLGYVPAEEAEILAMQGQSSGAIARLSRIQVRDTGFIAIHFDVLVQKRPREPKQPAKPKRPQVPVERPPSIEPVYIPKSSDMPESRTYCEKCKGVHLGMICPKCGNDHRGGQVASCDHCNTDYRDSRVRCPVCTVQQLLEKAERADTAGNLSKAITFWQEGYNEARNSRYGFSYWDVLTYTGYLAKAGFAEDAIRILSQVRTHCKEELAASSRTKHDFAKYFRTQVSIQKAMATAFASNRGKPSQHQVIGVIFCWLFHHLCGRCADHYLGCKPEENDCLHGPRAQYYTIRMQDALRKCKMNKKGRPEELQAIFVKHWATIPSVDTKALQQEILGTYILDFENQSTPFPFAAFPL